MRKERGARRRDALRPARISPRHGMQDPLGRNSEAPAGAPRLRGHGTKGMTQGRGPIRFGARRASPREPLCGKQVGGSARQYLLALGWHSSGPAVPYEKNNLRAPAPRRGLRDAETPGTENARAILSPRARVRNASIYPCCGPRGLRFATGCKSLGPEHRSPSWGPAATEGREMQGWKGRGSIRLWHHGHRPPTAGGAMLNKVRPARP